MRYFTFILLVLFVFEVQGQVVEPNDGSGGESMEFDFPCSEEDGCNLIIYNGLMDWVGGVSYSGGQEVEEDDEDNVGAVTVANKNDTDGDGTIDNVDMNGVINSAVGRNEIDLMRLDIKKPNPSIGGSVVLMVESGNIRLWENSNKTGLINLSSNMVSFPVSQLDKTIYVEAVEESQSIRDIELKLSYNGLEDIVKATAIWIPKNNSWSMNSSTPIAGEGDLSNLNDDDLLNLINSRNISMDNRRYGHGTFFSQPISIDNTTNDKRFGGRILFEFQILPTNLLGSNLESFVFYDITRQKKNRLYKIISGGTLGSFVQPSSVNFPWEGTIWQGISISDNELPNDDGFPDDEDNVPNDTNNLLYSFDPPGSDVYDLLDELIAFKVDLITYREFVRIRFMDNFDQDNQNVLDGSRASEKVNWSCTYYVKRNNNGLYKLGEDNEDVSASFPVKTSNFGANGIVSIVTTAGAPTQKYKLIFDKNGDSSKWRVEINGTPNVGLDSNMDANGPWTIDWMTNGIEINISQGSIPFQNDNGYTFSVFNSQNPMGKQNMISETDFDVTINP